ncbi:apolipoprotein D-like [Panonychus citri]|uniref:apolipoprotein D-like n=1 Tax=Panonychus citri TaxID=50023 RepID=UPI0023070F07|nr:apolipoprotein D-like [Panonychus citri]
MFSTLFVFALIGSAFCASCPKPPTVGDDFDITKFGGRWFEVVRTTGFTEDGLTCVTADFDLRPDGDFNTTNSAFRKNGQRATEYGTAKRVKGGQKNELAMVSSAIPIPINFYIIETDYDNYAAAYTCIGVPPLFSYETAWIFSRTNTLDADTTQRLQNRLTNEFGIYPSTIEVTNQTDCTYLPRGTYQ